MNINDLIGHIVCADCLDIMKNIPNESIDLICTDCPYKIIGGGCATSTYGNLRVDAPKGVLFRGCGRCAKKWETAGQLDENYENVKSGKMFANNDIEFEDWLPEIYRVLKNNTHCYIMVNGRNLAELQKQAEKVGFKYQNLLVWKKNNATPNKFYMQQLEFILMLRKGGERWINNLGHKNLLSVPNTLGGKNHPTEKPVPLMEILIANSTNENDIVLEPFAGAGATCIAAKNLNRRFIGIEIDPKYCDVANKRLEESQRQQMLF